MAEPSLILQQISGATVALCAQHGGCYTGDTLDRQLRDMHRIEHRRRRETIAEYQLAGLAASKEEVPTPADGGPAGIPLY
jgi:hypothetical protein